MNRDSCVVLCALALAAAPCGARVVRNPDPGTLWIEDGIGVETGPGRSEKHWSVDTLDVLQAPRGGITFSPCEEPRRSTGGRFLPVDPAYPWMVVEVTGASPQPKGNKGFAVPRVAKPGAFAMNMNGDVQKGLWVFNMLGRARGLAPLEWFRVDAYGIDITLGSIRMVRSPDYRIEVGCAAADGRGFVALGDEVVVRVVMKESAEDVTLSFFDSYLLAQVSLNGRQKLQLKPPGTDPRVWEARLTLERCEGSRLKPGEQFAPGRLLFKATILGGGIRVPLWSANDREFRIMRWEAPKK